MKLYRTVAGAWAGTQADAGKGFELVEFPTDKPGLLAWLNANVGGRADPVEEFPTLLPKAPPPAPKPRPVPRTGPAIVEYLLDEANQAEVESIFAAIGARVGEILRERRT